MGMLTRVGKIGSDGASMDPVGPAGAFFVLVSLWHFLIT